MAQQSAASRINSAMGGHPNPSYFFGSAAVLFKAAAEMIKKLAPKPKVEDKGETRPTPSPAPAAKTETKTETKPEPKPEPAKTDKK